jgi:serine/threonine protein kinase
MIVLNPDQRITLEEAIKHPYFAGLDEEYPDLSSACSNYRIRCYQNFRVRPPIKIHPDMRNIFVDFIISLLSTFKDMSQQTVLVAINVLDQYLASQDSHSNEEQTSLRNNLNIISICCVVLASKFIDIKPLGLESFTGRYPISTLIKWERTVFQAIGCELTQPTLLNFYREFMEDGKVPKRDNIPERHWFVARDMAAEYNLLQGKGIPELKELFLDRLKKAKC